MGVNIHGARFLCYAKAAGADFSTSATIARQGMSLSPAELRRVLGDFGHKPTNAEVTAILDGSGGYVEALLAYLGAAEVHSFDISPYEGATYIHDMNEPIGQAHKGLYSTVFDSGSLEHVFNVPTAMRNCMEMVRVGGHYICILPANNFFGHGFYQFSPEFFYGVFNEANGFELERLIAFEDAPDWQWRAAEPDAPWYEVESPLALRERVTLVNDKPLSLMAIARRVAIKPIFAVTPQQSDYAARWRDSEQAAPAAQAVSASRPLPVRLAKMLLPLGLRLAVRKAMQPRPRPLGRGFERRFFRPLDPRKGAR